MSNVLFILDQAQLSSIWEEMELEKERKKRMAWGIIPRLVSEQLNPVFR